MQKVKKMLALIMAAVMMLAMFSVSVLADEAKSVSTQEELVAAFEEDAPVIKLNSDITLDKQLIANSKTILDLNGHTLTVNMESEGIVVTQNGDLTISNGKITTETADDMIVVNGGKLTLNKGVNISGTKSVVTAVNDGTVKVAGADIYSTGSLDGTSGYPALWIDKGAHLYLESGSIFGDQYAAMIIKSSGTTAEITGGTVKSNSEINATIRVHEGASVTIKGTAEILSENLLPVLGTEDTTINVTGGTIAGVYGVTSYANANITGGTINGVVYAGSEDGEKGKINISGGTISGRIEAEGDGAELTVTGGKIDKTQVNAIGKGKVNITGGEFTQETLLDTDEEVGKGTFSISGGVFSKNIQKEFLAAGYVVSEQGGKYYVVPEKEPEKWPFTDVPEQPGNWIYDSAKYVYDRGIMTGMTKTTFGPAEKLSRAQFATILYRIAGPTGVSYKQIFPDVHQNDWFGLPVSWANEAGIITGYKNGTFGPADPITREQLAVMLYRYAQHFGMDTSKKEDLSKYQDASKVSDWATEAMRWAVGNGIITGKDGGKKLDPTGNASRAECATMVMRFMEKF